MRFFNKKAVLIIFIVLAMLSMFALSACVPIVQEEIAVTFDNEHKVTVGDTLESLKPYLTVIYTDDNGKKSDVTDYTLSGMLAEGQSKVTVLYNGLRKEFTVTVARQSTPDVNPQPDEYTVTFKSDGQVVGTQKYTTENKNITEPAVPEKTGYTGTWEQYALTTGDVTVNASYTAKQYSATLNYDGATGDNTLHNVTVTYNREIGELPTPTKTDYSFCGWYFGSSLVTSATVWHEDSSSVTFTAKWNKFVQGTQGLTYSENSDGTAYCTGIGTATDTDVTISSVYNGKIVVGIENNAFVSCSQIERLTIPDSIRSIGNLAFNFNSIDEINYLGTIESWCGIAGLQNLMGNSFNFRTFSINGEPVTDLVIPSSVTTIPIGAFDMCTNITSVTISDGVKIIDVSAFSGCHELASVIIPNSVTTIKAYAFSGNKFTSITIPDSVTSLEDRAFSDCERLASVVIGKGITKINKRVFSNCDELVDITIPQNIIEIGEEAFYNCSSLTNVTIGNGIADIAYQAFYNCESIANINYLGTLESWCGIEGLHNFMLYGALGKTFKLNGNPVTDVVIPDTVRKVSSYAFFKTNITSAKMSNKVTRIDDGTFGRCSNLKEVILGDKVTSMGVGVFSFCSSLTSILIPDRVKSISYDAFAHCTALTIYCEAEREPSDWHSLWNSSNRPVVWNYKGE